MLEQTLTKVIQQIGLDVKGIREALTGKLDKPANASDYVTKREVEKIVDTRINVLVINGDEVRY